MLSEVQRRLAGMPNLVRLVAFGSRVRGSARPDSDLDLMVVLNEGGSLAERGRRVYRHLVDFPVAVDLVIYTPEEHRRMRSFPSTVAGIAEKEGRVLVG